MPFDNPYQAPCGDLECLREARSRISSRDAWVQGQFRDGDRHCIVAVLSMVSGSHSFHTPNRQERRLSRHLAAQLPGQSTFWARMKFFTNRQRLMWFNDDPRTGHEDVMALFDRSIDRLTNEAPICISA